MTMAAAPGNPPGRIWYLVAVGIFLAGMVAMAVFLLTRLTGFDEGLTRFIVPGEQALTLDAGNYTIFHEAQSVIDGKIYASSGLGGLMVNVTGADGGEVALRSSGSGRYTFGGHTGFAVFDFTAASAGAYVVAGRYADGAPGPETVLAVGQGFLSSLLWTIFGALGIAFGGAAIAAAIGVTVLVKRRRAGLQF